MTKLRNPFVLFFAFILCFITLGTATMTPQEICSQVPSNNDLDLFHTERMDTMWPTYRPRQLRAKRCSDSGSVSYPAHKAGRIPVDCGKCAVLDLDVKARYRDCQGLVPELVQSRQDCIFQNKCNLDYRSTVISWIPKGLKYTQCLGQWPKKIQVSATCLNTEKHQVTDVIKTEQHTRSREGFIRSHFYDRQGRTKYPRGTSLYSFKNTLALSPPDEPTSNTFLLLHFHLINLAGDAKLQVLGSSLECQSTWSQGNTYVIHSRNLHKVSLLFSLDKSGQQGNGFDICFRWFKASNVATVLGDFQATLDRCNRYRNNAQGKPELPVFEVIQYAVSQHMSGVVRSHKGFPWNYPRPRRHTSRHFRGRARRWCKTVTHQLRAPLDQTTVKIRAGRLALAKGDKLEISGRNGTVFCARKGKTYDIESDIVTLKFTIRVSRLYTNQGFLLCYQWYSPDVIKQPDDDVCSSFALKFDCPKVQKQRSKSKSKRNKKRSNGQKGQKRSKRSKRSKRPKSRRHQPTLPRECWL